MNHRPFFPYGKQVVRADTQRIVWQGHTEIQSHRIAMAFNAAIRRYHRKPKEPKR